MPQLTYLYVDPAFHTALERVSANLPTVGAQQSSKTIVLAHYSKNASITSFNIDTKFSWTTKVSDDPEVIEKCIGMFSQEFKAIYLLKHGIGVACKTRIHSQGVMDEHAIDRSLVSSEFRSLLVKFDPNSNRYVVI